MKAAIGALHRGCWQGMSPGSHSTLPNTMGTTCLRDQEANEYRMSALAPGLLVNCLSCILEPGLKAWSPWLESFTKARLDANLNTEVMSIQLDAYAHSELTYLCLPKEIRYSLSPEVHPFRQTSPTLVGPPGTPLSLSAFKDTHMRCV